MTVTEIKSLEEYNEVVERDEYCAIDFWAEWCGPCRMISPVFEELSGSVHTVKFYKVNVDDQPEVSEKAGIKAMPTFKLFRKGVQVDELVGANPPQLQVLLSKAV